MKGYLSIGKVSKLKNVSIKSLRYYDEIGILKPAYINEETNYRYYKEEQLFILDAISLCIELGIPLRSFPKYYDAGGRINLQELLFDAKELAEEKIISMHKCIDTLQQTLRMLEGSHTPQIPSRNIEKRHILTIPFDETTTCERYNHKLLSLFVEAQRTGITATYPSGLLYEGIGTQVQKYVFVHVEGDVAPGTLTQDSGDISVENTPEHLNRNIAEHSGAGETEDMDKPRLRTLPEGSYYVCRTQHHQIEQAGSIFPSLLTVEKKDHYLLIETDVLRDEPASGTSAAALELELLYLKR
jgi:DNA-binding transcriptional MerR regulator